MVWIGLGWLGLVLAGLDWSLLVWFYWFGLVFNGLDWSGLDWYGLVLAGYDFWLLWRLTSLTFLLLTPTGALLAGALILPPPWISLVILSDSWSIISGLPWMVVILENSGPVEGNWSC